jgi:molybdate transport system substrate-binding protein
MIRGRRQFVHGASALSAASFVALSNAQTGAPSAAPRRVLKIAAAAGLVDVLRSIAKVVEAKRPGLTVNFEVGASDSLAARVGQGLPFDIIAFSDDFSMSKAVTTGRVERHRVIEFAKNKLSIISTLKIAAPGDLLEERFARICIGDPTQVPAGRYARDSLVLNDLWARLESRMVYASNVRQVLDFVSRGGTQAGIVYRSELLVKAARGLNHVPISGVVQHYIAPVGRTAPSEDAAAFLEMATSPSAKAALKQLNFE